MSRLIDSVLKDVQKKGLRTEVLYVRVRPELKQALEKESKRRELSVPDVLEALLEKVFDIK